MEIDDIVIRNLQFNENYTRKVIQFLKEDYFETNHHKAVFKIIQNFFDKYNSLPNNEAILIELKRSGVPEGVFKNSVKLIKENNKNKNETVDLQWSIDQTEQFCKDRSLFLALQESIMIADGKKGDISKSAIPDILKDALGVTFDINIGHDYLRDAEERFEYYKEGVSKIPFQLATFNNITNGGVERKTLNAILGGTGMGKTMFFCDLAAQYIQQGYNCLYITLEIEEKKIGERIDANLMNINISNVRRTETNTLMGKVSQLREKSLGTLKIKEYPNGSVHVGHFKYLLQEFETKENFIPDIVFIDYLSICGSQRVKDRSNSYTYSKSIAEELRAFAQEYNIAIWTGVQSNRDGQTTEEIDITNTSESMGGPFTFDFFFGIVVTEELQQDDQALLIQLKSRYSDIYKTGKKHVIGMDRGYMRVYDLNDDRMSR